MLPIVIDPNYIKALVAGKGPATENRLKMLRGAGVKNVRYIEFEPVADDFTDINIAYIADFDDEVSGRIAELARSKGVMLNIEDKKKYCDFHVPSIVRKGDLMINISTAGKSPRVARRLRMMFETLFSDEWSQELDNIAELRERIKSEGGSFKELAEATDELLEQRGMFNNFCDDCKSNSK